MLYKNPSIYNSVDNDNAEKKTFKFSSNNIITQTKYNSYLNNSNCEFILYLKNGIGVLSGWFTPSSSFNVSYSSSDIGGDSAWPVIFLLDVTDIKTTNFYYQVSFLYKGDTPNNNHEFVCSTIVLMDYNNRKYLSIGTHAVQLNSNRAYNLNPSTLIL